MNLVEDIEALYARQLRDWKLAHDNYAALTEMLCRVVTHNGREMVLQYNPGRYRSAAARVDAASVASRPCFLCPEHQPVEQASIVWKTQYKIQINPYPVFSRHLTLSSVEHQPQAIESSISDMMNLAAALPGYVLFYNGPRCGASAPDHLHFQAVPFEELPLCSEAVRDDCDLEVYYPFFYIIRRKKNVARHWFDVIEAGMREMYGNTLEPMQNVFCWKIKTEWHILIVPRSKHRPDCYGEGERQLLISPGSLEMAGVWPLVRESDFEKVTAARLQAITEEVAISEDDKDYLLDYFRDNIKLI